MEFLFYPSEIIFNILSFVDCLKLSNVQLVSHQVRNLIPLVHKSHKCSFFMWVEASRLIESKFKRSKRSKGCKLTNQFELNNLFLPQYGCTLYLYEIQLKKRFYVIEISDYLDRGFVIKWIPIQNGRYDFNLDPLNKFFSLSVRKNDDWPPKFYFGIDLITFDCFFRHSNDVFLDEIDKYSSNCNFVSTRPFHNQQILVNKQCTRVKARKIMDWIEDYQVRSSDGKWYKCNLELEEFQGCYLHVYHFRNFSNLWFIVTKLFDQNVCHLFLLNEKNEMVKLREQYHATYFVYPIYCPWSNAVFILSDFKNGLIKFYQF